MEIYCPKCDEDFCVEMDGYKILDSCCPECGWEFDYEEASRDWLGSMTDAATSIYGDY